MRLSDFKVSKKQIKMGGFTLIELLFAFMIMAVMLSLLFNAMYTVIKGVKIVDRVFETPSKALVLSKIFERELTGIYLPELIPLAIKKDKKGNALKSFIKEQMIFGLKGRNREIHFTTLVPLREAADSKLGDVIELGYSFDKNNKVLTRRKDPIPDNRLDKGGETQDLKLDLSDVKFEYYGKKWEDRWDSTKTKKLPRAVRVTFKIIPAEQNTEKLGEKEIENLSIEHRVVVLLPNAVDNKRL
tara:strand:+ start:1125 stop:1853 length:729 start_codon:yes stop_codon:yes gene_type:complete